MTAKDHYVKQKQLYRTSRLKPLGKIKRYKVKGSLIEIVHYSVKTPTKEWTRKAEGKYYYQHRMGVIVDGVVQFDTYTRAWDGDR